MTFNKCSKQVPAACIMDPQFHEEINRLSLLDKIVEIHDKMTFLEGRA
jgi:hypothetical protein